ncbi:NADH-quinone oxidoreductase subunit H [candidate division KSB1 bacterium]|nr:NADH-quinone oxidoreductase subunit H [candidate division KSB1 bacterium]
MMQLIEIILTPIFALIIGIFFLGLSRKIIARIHWRYGPPITQPVIDIIRLFSQKSVSHGHLFDLGIILSLAGAIVVVLFIPFGHIHPMSSSGGMLVIIYMMLFSPLGIALSSAEAANPNISIGISRKLLLSLAYEIPFLLVLLAVMTHYKTISLVDIVRIQQDTGWALISLPLVLSGIAYILILPAILGVRPFELVQAQQEISSGPMAEYGGPFLALATMQHAINLFIGVALFVNLFLGGAGNPVTFFLKMVLVYVLLIFVHASLPRLRIEQAFDYLLKWPTFIAFIGMIIVVLVRRS